jgi:hypothetical protein
MSYIGYESEYDLGGINRLENSLESIVRNNLLIYFDAAKSQLDSGTLFYRWFNTDGTNPTTKAEFDSFFSQSPAGTGIHTDGIIDWVNLSLKPSYITADISFAWEVSGILIIDEPGDYVFNIRSDDGNQLEINGSVVASFYGGRGVPNPGDISSTIFMSQGYHSFRYRMQQGAGGAGAQVGWQKPGSQSFEVIPKNNFAHFLNSSVIDLSGTSNTPSISGGFLHGVENKNSFVLNGVDTVLNIPFDLNKMNFSSAQSICIWMKPGQGSESARRNPYNQAYGGSGTMTYEINKTINYFFGTNGGNGTPYVGRNSGFTVQNDEIAFIAVTRNQSTNSCKWYKNGNLERAYDAGGYVSTNNGSSPILIGAGYTSNFWGDIHSIMVYNRELTELEVRKNFNATRERYGI